MNKNGYCSPAEMKKKGKKGKTLTIKPLKVKKKGK